MSFVRFLFRRPIRVPNIIAQEADVNLECRSFSTRQKSYNQLRLLWDTVTIGVYSEAPMSLQT